MQAVAADLSSSTSSPTHHDLLVEAMRSERRLLDSLADILERQRSAVSTDDLALLDESVFAAQRVLRTLGEARRRRRALLELLVGSNDLLLTELDDAFGRAFTPDLRRARDELQGAAERLAATLEQNRRVLGGALHAGDRLIRALCGAPDKASAYGAHGQQACAGETLLIDRQA